MLNAQMIAYVAVDDSAEYEIARAFLQQHAKSDVSAALNALHHSAILRKLDPSLDVRTTGVHVCHHV
jgi:hypothetical protein